MREVGNASANYELGKRFNKDFANAERLTIPITLIILLVAFGTLVAAGLPVLLSAFSAVLASLGLYSLVTHAYPGDYQSTSSVVLLIGMAVGVDYSLFYLRREREERAAGREPRPALLRAAGTSGQAVLISGVTVLIAMAGMLFAGNKIFTSIGIGTMIVVFAAMVGSLTVLLQALLHKLGDRIEKGRIPFLGRLSAARPASRASGTRSSAPRSAIRPSRSSSARGRCWRAPCRFSACTRSCRASPTCSHDLPLVPAPTSSTIQAAFPRQPDSRHRRRSGHRDVPAARGGGQGSTALARAAHGDAGQMRVPRSSSTTSAGPTPSLTVTDAAGR